jgi:uncharacterized glyoxalase superfamily protein PhnB
VASLASNMTHSCSGPSQVYLRVHTETPVMDFYFRIFFATETKTMPYFETIVWDHNNNILQLYQNNVMSQLFFN